MLDNYILHVADIFEVQLNVRFFLPKSAGYRCYLMFNDYLFPDFNTDISILKVRNILSM